MTEAAALLVCTVESTRCPVSEARMAVLAVSTSRISPIMITSGSRRRMERRQWMKSSPIAGLICI